MEKTTNRPNVGTIGHIDRGRASFRSLLSAGLMSLLGAGVPVHVSRNRPTRSWSWKGGSKKTVYPAQTEAQREAALGAASYKRATRRAKATDHAERSAAGYHPIARHVEAKALYLKTAPAWLADAVQG